MYICKYIRNIQNNGAAIDWQHVKNQTMTHILLVVSVANALVTGVESVRGRNSVAAALLFQIKQQLPWKIIIAILCSSYDCK